jgi:hypothetical protein
VTRSAKYYARNRAAGLKRVSIWIRPGDRPDLEAWLQARGLTAPATERKRRTAADHPELPLYPEAEEKFYP